MNFKNKKQKFNPVKPSSEEQFIKNYLDENDIKYIAEYKIYNLKDDKKNSRRVDFYLPKLGIYLEHFGWYNKNKHVREEYDEKARVYIKNSLPTVILYPHELGFLDYAIHNKILKVLRVPKFNSKSKLFRYKLNRYFMKGKPYFLFLSFFTLLFTIDLTKDNNVKYDLIFGVGFATSIQLLALFIRNFVRIFFKDF
jgi:hypothetical protein